MSLSTMQIYEENVVLFNKILAIGRYTMCGQKMCAECRHRQICYDAYNRLTILEAQDLPTYAEKMLATLNIFCETTAKINEKGSKQFERDI